MTETNRLVLITRGLPGSGKSFYAKKLCRERAFKRLNKDDLRNMIDAGEWSPAQEEVILDCQLRLLSGFLHGRHDIVIDDTNIEGRHIERITNFVQEHYFGDRYEVRVVDFTHIPFEVCQSRNSNRKGKANVPMGAMYRMRTALDIKFEPKIPVDHPNVHLEGHFDGAYSEYGGDA